MDEYIQEVVEKQLYRDKGLLDPYYFYNKYNHDNSVNPEEYAQKLMAELQRQIEKWKEEELDEYYKGE